MFIIILKKGVNGGLWRGCGGLWRVDGGWVRKKTPYKHLKKELMELMELIFNI